LRLAVVDSGVDRENYGPGSGLHGMPAALLRAMLNSMFSKLIAGAQVEDAMRPGVISCSPETTLREVARIMATKHIHCLVVARITGRGEEPAWSMISGLDLVAAASDDFAERTAGEAASSDPVTVSSEARLDRAAQLMVEHRVEHLLVVGAHDGRPAGVLSTLDIAGVMSWAEA
jgi:CBS domain-containing protein